MDNQPKDALVLDRRLYEERRLELKLSPERLATKAGVDRRTLDRIVSGRTASPQTVTMDAIAGALKVETAELWRLPQDLEKKSSPQPRSPQESCERAPTLPDDCLFDPWTPAIPPAFVGRLDILRAFESAAMDGRSVSLVGERRMGKSSILRTWAARAAVLGWPLRLLSGEGPEAADHRAFVAQLIAAAPAQPTAERSSSGSVDADGRDGVPESADGAADWLDAWCRAQAAVGADGVSATPNLQRRVPLVLLDEAEVFLQRADPRFLERLRGMITARKLRLVVATARELDSVYADLGRTSPFPNLLEFKRVALLDAPAARQLIARGGPHWRPDDPDWMLDWAGNHPFYLTLLARRLLEARREGRSREQALDAFRDEAETQLRLWWNGLDEPTRTLLQSAARGETVDTFRLRRRGLLTDDNRPLGRVMSVWLSETSN